MRCNTINMKHQGLLHLIRSNSFGETTSLTASTTLHDMYGSPKMSLDLSHGRRHLQYTCTGRVYCTLRVNCLGFSFDGKLLIYPFSKHSWRCSRNWLCSCEEMCVYRDPQQKRWQIAHNHLCNSAFGHCMVYRTRKEGFVCFIITATWCSKVDEWEAGVLSCTTTVPGGLRQFEVHTRWFLLMWMTWTKSTFDDSNLRCFARSCVVFRSFWWGCCL